MDPDYALPWFGLALFYWTLGLMGVMPSRAAIAKCEEASLKALELDELLPEAHSLIGVLKAMQFDWEGAERKFRRAMELGPNVVDVLLHYAGYYLVPMQRFNEAILVMQSALELDPISPIPQIPTFLGYIFWYARQYNRALELFRNSRDLHPRFPGLHLGLGLTLIVAGKIDEGVKAIENAAQLLGRIPAGLAMLGFAYAKAGRISDAQNLIVQLQELAQKAFVPPYVFVSIYFALGETGKCLDWMEKAVEELDFMASSFATWPIYDPLRSHPRYKALLRKMNLEA